MLTGVIPALSATTTTTFTVQITITASCVINSASTLNFGIRGVLTANVDQTSTIQVQCTNATPYNIGLNAGTGTGATVNTRKMSSGGGAVRYGDVLMSPLKRPGLSLAGGALLVAAASSPTLSGPLQVEPVLVDVTAPAAAASTCWPTRPSTRSRRWRSSAPAGLR